MSILIAAALSAAMTSPVEPMQARGAPRGTYTRSCTEAYVNRGRLYADCRASDRRVYSTSIEVSRCNNNDIANNEGRLVCGNVRGDIENRPGQGGQNRPGQGGWQGNNRPGQGPGQGGWQGNNRPGQGPGQGGWQGNNRPGAARSLVVVYDNVGYRGSSRNFYDTDSNLANTPFNDRIRSMRVTGRWEICTDSNFRGRCTIVDRDISDLRSIGMSNSISSMRPVGRY